MSPLLIAALLVLHPHSGPLPPEDPDPITETVTAHYVEQRLDVLEAVNGPYEWQIGTAISVSKPKPKAKARSSSGLRLKPGHEAATLRWRPLVERYWAPSDVNRALCIISYESGGNPKAKSRSGSYLGLFQQAKKYWPERARKAGWAGASALDAEANIAVSAWLKNQGGWSHWTIRRCR